MLTHCVISARLAEPVDERHAGDVGSALVRLGYSAPEALSQTLAVLAEHLLVDLSKEDAATLRPRIAVLLGALGAGFVYQVRTALHEEEESILAALLTDKQRAAVALQRQAALLDLARDAILVRDAATDAVVFWNHGAEAVFGWSRDEVVDKPARAVLQTHFPQPLAEIEAALERDGRWEGELGHIRKDGSAITAASRWALQRDDEGRPVAVLEISTEITARKQMELALRERDASSETAQRIAHLGSFHWDFVTNVVHWSDEMFRLLGYTPGQVTPSFETFIAAVHPQDHPLMAEFMEGAHAGRSHPFELRTGGLGGVVRTLHTQTEAVCDTTGTAQLIFGTALDITERRQAEAALAEHQQRLQDLVGRMLIDQEEERRRVAYEIHDDLAQLAVGAQQHIETFARHYRPRRPAAREELERARVLAQRTVREARRVIAGLRPTALDDFGLATALRLDIEALCNDGWRISYQEALGPQRLPPAVETALFRVAQEALTNVGKHAGPTRVQVSLHRRGSTIRLAVCDWGHGFDPRAVDRGGPGQHVGLAGMRERISLLGGRWRVRSRPGAGTRLLVRVPVPDSAQLPS